MWTTVARTKRRVGQKIPTLTSFGSAPPLSTSEFGAFRHGFLQCTVGHEVLYDCTVCTSISLTIGQKPLMPLSHQGPFLHEQDKSHIWNYKTKVLFRSTRARYEIMASNPLPVGHEPFIWHHDIKAWLVGQEPLIWWNQSPYKEDTSSLSHYHNKEVTCRTRALYDIMTPKPLSVGLEALHLMTSKLIRRTWSPTWHQSFISNKCYMTSKCQSVGYEALYGF